MAKTITINVEEKVERRFRKLAGAMYGRKKGYLGKAVTKALENWIIQKEANDAVAKSLALLDKGIKAKKWVFNRDEIYAERA